jgi:Asp-tRNA(Asn)/Glu-tRNA(Gln) amidotransferase A subunit family amidase
MTYMPSLTLPASGGADNLPLGVQLVTPRFADDALLSFARWLEERQPNDTMRLPPG